MRQFGSNRNTSTGPQARGVARTRNCYMLAIQQLAGINRIEDAAECAPIACLSSPAVHMRRLPLPKDAASERVAFHCICLHRGSHLRCAVGNSLICRSLCLKSMCPATALPCKLCNAVMIDYAEA